MKPPKNTGSDTEVLPAGLLFVRVFAEIALVGLFVIIFYLDYYRTNYLHGFPYNIGF